MGVDLNHAADTHYFSLSSFHSFIHCGVCVTEDWTIGLGGGSALSKCLLVVNCGAQSSSRDIKRDLKC